MNHRMPGPAERIGLRVVAGLVMLMLTACQALRPANSRSPDFYSLDSAPSLTAPVAHNTAAPLLRTLIVNPPRAASGFDSQRIMYVREAHKLAYFAHSEWVDPPARMLGPLLVAAISHVGAFGTVVLTPASATGQWRLDSQIIRLQQNFSTRPSRVQFSLRVYLTDETSRDVLAWREFNAETTATSDDTQGGVQAANLAVQDVLAQVVLFLSVATHGH